MSGLWKPTQHELLIYALAVCATLMGAIPTTHARDINPPEVQALIGMRIPAKAPGRHGDVPGWKEISSALLQHSTPPDNFLGVEELIRGKLSIFIIDRSNGKNFERTILDAQLLPQNLLSYRVINGKVVARRDRQRHYFLATDCSREDEVHPIVALARPKAGMERCENVPAEVKRAWLIHKQTGKIEDIPVTGINCFFATGEDCFPY